MRRIGREERVSSRIARDRGDAPPILTPEEQLHPVTIELLRKVDGKDGDITEITVNIPSVDDILDQQMQTEPNKQSTYNMLAKACDELTPTDLKTMHPRDFRVLSEVYWSFQE